MEWGEDTINSPAAIVSPPRLIKTRPISLFAENVSRGIGRAVTEGPVAVVRSVICTSAGVPLVKTLRTRRVG